MGTIGKFALKVGHSWRRGVSLGHKAGFPTPPNPPPAMREQEAASEAQAFQCHQRQHCTRTQWRPWRKSWAGAGGICSSSKGTTWRQRWLGGRWGCRKEVRHDCNGLSLFCTGSSLSHCFVLAPPCLVGPGYKHFNHSRSKNKTSTTLKHITWNLILDYKHSESTTHN